MMETHVFDVRLADGNRAGAMFGCASLPAPSSLDPGPRTIMGCSLLRSTCLNLQQPPLVEVPRGDREDSKPG